MPVIIDKPGQLSQVAAYLTLLTAVLFLVNSPLFNGQGTYGDWTNVTYGIIFLPWGVILLLLARRLMADKARHVIWGSAVATCNGLTGILNGGPFLTGNFSLAQGLTLTLLLFGSALGVVGGLLGVFWKPSSKLGATALEI